MNAWLRLACERTVVRRAAMYAIVVGSVLAAINHGDAILSKTLSTTALWKIGVTYLVPYAVSTLSSVGALRRVSDDKAATANRHTATDL